MVLMFWFAPLSKPVTLVPFKERCQIKSELVHFRPPFLCVSFTDLRLCLPGGGLRRLPVDHLGDDR